MLAPLLYMLALAGIGAAVMFSGYSQILRSNAEMTAVNAARSQLQSAGQTLSASSVLDTATSSIVQPPAVFAFSSIASSDLTRLPAPKGGTPGDPVELTNFVTATGSPHDAGAVDVSTGVRQLDPWGKYYVYCRWENAVANPSQPSLTVISAGPDGVVDTKCGDTTAQGDDRIITSTVAETINRANVWQVSSSSQVKFGLDSNAVRVNQDGSLLAASLLVTEAAAGNPTPIVLKDKSGNTVFTVTDTGALIAGTATAANGVFTTLSVASNAGVGSLGVVGGATVGTTLGVTGITTLTGALNANGGTSTTTLNTSALATLNSISAGSAGLGNTQVTGTLGATGDFNVGGTKFTVAAASGNTVVAGSLNAGATTLASLNLTTPLGITSGGTGAGDAATARTNLGLGTMATQNASAVAITGGTITGVTITGNVSGSAGSVAASGVTGCCVPVTAGGTGAGDAATARADLGTNDASNLTTGVIAAGLLPASGVVAPGPYNEVWVDSTGRVTQGANMTASQWATSGSDVNFGGSGTGDVGIGTTSAQERLTVDGNIAIEGPMGSVRNLYYETGTGKRWSVNTNGAHETGSPVNTGSDFVIGSFDDTGAALANVLTITRSTSAATFAGSVTAPNFYGTFNGTVNGAGSGSLALNDGAAATPSLYFTADTDTGLYRPGSDVLGVAAGGKDVVRFVGNTAAVNYFTMASAIASSPVVIGAAGTDTDISITLSPKGAGGLNLGTNYANYIYVRGAATGNAPTVAAAGSDTDVGISLAPKGAGSVQILSGAAAAKPFTVKSAASQTGDLAEFQDSSGAALTIVDANGNVGIGTTTASSPLTINSASTSAIPVSIVSTGINSGSNTYLATFYGKNAGPAIVEVGNIAQGRSGAASGSVLDIGVSTSTAGGPAFVNSTYFGPASTYTPLALQVNNAIGFEVYGGGVNYTAASGSGAGNAPMLSAMGSDTDIDLALSPKGAGSVDVSSTADAVVAISSGGDAVIATSDDDGSTGVYGENTGDGNGGYFVADGSGQAVVATAGTGVGLQVNGGTTTANIAQFTSHSGTLQAYVSTVADIGVPAGGHFNFGATSGDSGYGIRDNSGVIECKNSGSSWAACGTVGGHTQAAGNDYDVQYNLGGVLVGDDGMMYDGAGELMLNGGSVAVSANGGDAGISAGALNDNGIGVEAESIGNNGIAVQGQAFGGSGGIGGFFETNSLSGGVAVFSVSDQPGAIALVAKAASGQTANLMEFRNSLNAVLSSVSASGVFTGNGSALTNLNASNLASGTVPTARLGTGTASSSTYLRGDGTWAVTSAITGTPAGAATQVQFNNGGTAFGADSGFTYAGNGVVSITTSSNANGLTITNSNSNPSAHGIVAQQTSITGITYAGWFNNSSTSGTAVFGNATATSGTNYGGQFESYSSGGISLYAQAGNAGTMPLVIRAAASQTGNLAQFQNSAGTALMAIDANGQIGVGQPGDGGYYAYNTSYWGAPYTPSQLGYAIDAPDGVIHALEFYSDDTVQAGYFYGDGSGLYDLPPASPGGSNTDVQYNSAGSMNGDSGFTYAGSGAVTITGAAATALSVTTTANSSTGITVTNSGSGAGTAYAAKFISSRNITAFTTGSYSIGLYAGAGSVASPPSSGSSGVYGGYFSAADSNGFGTGVLAQGAQFGLSGSGTGSSGIGVSGTASGTTGRGGSFSSSGGANAISLVASAGSAATPVLVVGGTASQAADLAEFTDNLLSPLSKVDASGNFSAPSSGYYNFGATTGTSGYGFHDNGGTLQYKNSGGTWTNLGGGTPAGTATQVQFNSGGTAFGADSGFTYAGSGAVTINGAAGTALSVTTSNSSGIGVHATGTTGLWGSSSTTGGVAVSGSATASGLGYGGYFTSSGTTGIGVRGEATSTAGTLGIGGWFLSDGSSGGVALKATSGAPAVTGLMVQAASGQTADLAEFQNSGGAVLTVVNASGSVGIGTSNPASPLHVVQSGASNANYDFDSNTASVQITSPSFSESSIRLGDTGSGFARISHAERSTLAGGGGSYVPRLAFGGDVANTSEYLTILMTGPSVGAEGNVGIGTVAPTQKLQVAGVIQSTSGGIMFPDGTTQTTAANFANGLLINTSVSGSSVGNFQNNGTASQSTGVIGYATSTTAPNGMGGQFESNSPSGYGVYGIDASATGNTFGVYGVASSATGYGVFCSATKCGGSAAWTSTSDKRLKTTIADLPDEEGLSAIMKLRPITYHWKDATKDKGLGKQLGFIAQQVEKVLPEAVLTGGDTTIDYGGGKKETIHNTKSMGYAELVVPLVKAVQEQQAQIASLKAANDNLKAANDNLRREFEAYERAHP